VFVGFEVLTVVIMKSTIFWVVTVCGLVEAHQHSACHMLVAGFLLSFLFSPGDEGNKFWQKIAGLLPYYITLQPGRS
jgi:hypothetical protein